MISFLNGIIATKNENGVIIDVGGVGYSVSMPVSDIASIRAVRNTFFINVMFFCYLLLQYTSVVPM